MPLLPLPARFACHLHEHAAVDDIDAVKHVSMYGDDDGHQGEHGQRMKKPAKETKRPVKLWQTPRLVLVWQACREHERQRLSVKVRCDVDT